uniref:Uncharacterized protein n=1 Tax=Hyaloperonospora arabidopsidis (strain Emoy2) TaxID=559515 RepID=M4C2Y0_HYAAE
MTPWLVAVRVTSSSAVYSAVLFISLLLGMWWEHVHTTEPLGLNSAAPAPGVSRQAPSKRSSHPLYMSCASSMFSSSLSSALVSSSSVNSFGRDGQLSVTTPRCKKGYPHRRPGTSPRRDVTCEASSCLGSEEMILMPVTCLCGTRLWGGHRMYRRVLGGEARKWQGPL